MEIKITEEKENALFGRKEGDLVRARWKEESGEGLRDREVANIAVILIREGPKYITLVVAAILILGLIRGYQESEK